MHGLGNDFVIVDGRSHAFRPDPDTIRAICDRHRGVGGDQLLVIEPPSAPTADARMRIYNVDGTEAETCLNATRCVCWLLLEEGFDKVRLETLGGLIAARRAAGGDVALRLGAPRWDWAAIPLSQPADTGGLDMESGPLSHPVALNLGNPHLVCFVPDRDAVDVRRWAPALAANPALPEGANIGIAQVVTDDRLRAVVWERPGILTQACGSGACAAVLAARRRGLITARRVVVEMPGGNLTVEVHEDDSLTLTGPVAIAFSGRFSTDHGIAA
ncbi:diaminopimelate epimerase [Paracoccus suum]|uniref:Diaminopimelate epimerase n=1 Tax=Paracoccus suum TaxID=2259340 RepID=A0A344PLF0_9RHOB|nr:diaminopimelate epimerase [Paracoccus suum]AXC50205.1 diaminopimelate epimerase [Paracoccus suum]